MGLGGIRGLNIIMGRPLKSEPPMPQIYGEMRALFALRHSLWPKRIAPLPDLVLHDIQFWCCEYQKYVRASHGKGGGQKWAPRSCPRHDRGLHRACTCGKSSAVTQRLAAARGGGFARAAKLTAKRRRSIAELGAKACRKKRRRLN